MAGRYGWSRSVAARVRTLRVLVHDTQQALQDVVDILNIDQEVHATVQEVGNQALRTTALIILGNNNNAKARLLHCLLGRKLLPEDMPTGCRWIRIQHGNSTQVHLSLGNSEFELVEELECNKRAWEVLPEQDLIRRDNTELTTILEVELNNQFLKDGLRIIIPPDIKDPGNSNHLQLKNIHSELYAKRIGILRNFNCVYLYAVDRMGKNIYSDNICGVDMSRSEEDFWSTFNMYTSSVKSDSDRHSDRHHSDKVRDSDRVMWMQGSEEPAVFNSENCLDLHQIKDINPHSQPMFIMFSNAVEMCAHRPGLVDEATESVGGEDMTEVDREMSRGGVRPSSESPEVKQYCDSQKQRLNHEQIVFMNELVDQWELMTNRPQKHYVKSQWAIVNDTELLHTVNQKHNPSYSSPNETSKGKRHEKIVKTRSGLLSVVVKFATQSLHSYLLEYCSKLSEVHIKLVQRFILASFDMARELQVVPKKIQFIAVHEQHLFETINAKFSEGDKKQELLQMMQEVLQELHQDINSMDWTVDDLPSHRDPRFITNSSLLCSSRSSAYISLPLSQITDSLSDGEEAASYDSYNLDDYDIIGSTEDSFAECMQRVCERYQESPVSSNIRIENELESFSTSTSNWTLRSDATTCTTNVSIKHATNDVQQTVLTRLSRKISLKLVEFFDCLKESYFGTLQRCIESLESSCRRELGGAASEAMRQLLSVGRQVQLQPETAFSMITVLLDSLRRIFTKLRIVGGEDSSACCPLSPAWRRRVARDTARALSHTRLARIISARILERLSGAHARYQAALAALEDALCRRLHHTQDVKLAIRKKYAPLFARLCLESTSMCDLLMHGTPELGREIGRGQYGVVYSVRGEWGGHAPVAVKSVVPADDRHYHELAMEFFYTRSIPVHPRIVAVHGSIVQRSGGRCVLLVTSRLARDLHAAVRAGLPRALRMRIALDIVEGIRYLHSLGLVHRDIKLKNVLLTAQNRAALSDLGFCTAGALMSGSVVGTPIHMAPELLEKDYCSAVDVYAFGILFWYLCAGDIKLPDAFETCHNKDQLWSKVKKGLRPERLPHFTDECWSVMESCWHPDPQQRALLGDIHQKLNHILEHTIATDNSSYATCNADDNLSLDASGHDDFDM